MSKKKGKATKPAPTTKKGTASVDPEGVSDGQGKKQASNVDSGSTPANVEATGPKKVPLFDLKPYMRTPKLLLNNYCQKERRPKPIYNKVSASKGTFRYVVILNDPKGREENALKFETKESFVNNDLAQHYAAMLALKHLEGSRPLYKLFPSPLDEAWLSMDTNNPMVSMCNEFVSQKEKALTEVEKLKKLLEERNKKEIADQKQKLEIPTLSMSRNIRRRTIGIINRHFPIVSKSYSFKSWLFDQCESFSGLPRSVSKPKLVSLGLERMSDSMREKYSSFLKSNGQNIKMILLSLKYWSGIDYKDREGIIQLIKSCGFDSERATTALSVLMREIDEYNKFTKDLCALQKGVYMDHFRISDICIVTDIEISSYPRHYVAWLCIMWLSIHLGENELPPLITPKRAQIEVKDYSSTKPSKLGQGAELISEEIKSLFASTLKIKSSTDIIEDQFAETRRSPKFSGTIRVSRQKHLSASKNAEEIVGRLKANQILVVKGETGCGKTTQIPILIYEGITQFTEGMIYCSEPRRLAAVSVSARVRSEVAKDNKGVIKDLIGHSVRLDHSVTNNTRLVYCTHGILINIIKSELMNISSHKSSSKQLCIPLNSVLILDEAHERSLDVDLLLYFMKQLSYQRRDIKLVIMSASIEVTEFANYFNKSFNDEVRSGSRLDNAPDHIGNVRNELSFQIDTISLPGRTPFPIEVHYLPIKQGKNNSGQPPDLNCSSPLDDEEFSNLESQICKPLDIPKLKDHVLSIIKSLGTQEGSVLIFLGGIGDVNYLTKLLIKEFEENEQDPVNSSNSTEKVELPIPLHVLPCHSNINYNDQLEIFKPVHGKRKVIVSTNIAEVSLTIEDVRFVIDTGRVRISIYDPIRHVTSLQEVFISKSSAQQRMGRAGRTAPGKCFRLFTPEELQSQPLEITPEILRLPIEHIILDILCFLRDHSSENHSNVRNSKSLRNSFMLIQLIHSLQDFFTPPKLSSIETSLLSLRNYGALNDHFAITPLGELLSRWPVDLCIGILFIYGLIFDCIHPIVTIAAFLTCEIPWKLEERRLPKSSTNCDYMIFIKVYNFYVEHFKSSSNRKRQNVTSILQSIENHQLPFDPTCLDISKMETIYQTKKHLLRILSIRDTFELLDEAQIFSKWNSIQTCLAASLYPNVACIRLPKKIKYVESGSGLFAETIQFNKLHLYRKDRLSKKSIGHFFTPQPKERPITVSQAYDLLNDSEDVSRVFLSESSAIYNRMYDLGTYHCIMYMSLFQSFAQKRTVLRFPISTSMYSLLLFASESLQLNPISLINQMKLATLDPSSNNAKKPSTSDQEGSLNHILIDDWILLQCPGLIQSIVWYFRHVSPSEDHLLHKRGL
ncbi:hypothetical protein OJ253_2536 [Cryptosporidium canis]|uniref:Uncharacterized protein n=1 Tax=Cryptosporidium canis TaxID=195482 RepID=A0A9D5DGB0_9CRYT|nr:hypothetical protein OJ253_2536 [Cryptosporidium canis]